MISKKAIYIHPLKAVIDTKKNKKKCFFEQKKLLFT